MARKRKNPVKTEEASEVVLQVKEEHVNSSIMRQTPSENSANQTELLSSQLSYQPDQWVVYMLPPPLPEYIPYHFYYSPETHLLLPE